MFLSGRGAMSWMSFSSPRVVARCLPAQPGSGLLQRLFPRTARPDRASGSLDEVDENTILEVMARYATEPYLPPGS
jgi:hypothetical protein